MVLRFLVAVDAWCRCRPALYAELRRVAVVTVVASFVLLFALLWSLAGVWRPYLTLVMTLFLYGWSMIKLPAGVDDA